MIRARALFVAVAFPAIAVVPATGGRATAATTGRYIVQFDAGSDPVVEADRLRASGVEVVEVYDNVFPGVVVQATSDVIGQIRASTDVVRVEPDQVMSLDAVEPLPPTVLQSDPSWGLDRLDQRSLPLSNGYSYNRAGAGVSAYIIDSGIHASHVDFGGRVRPGFTTVSDGLGTDDCAGHGTHVAGTVGGQTWGVAKSVSLVAVRVLDCGGFTTASQLLQALNWVITDHQAGTPAVANLSIGGQQSAVVDDAVQAVINDGITVVVAAGNENQDACTKSPARVPAALTVAASTKTDTRASFSNFGSCVDLFGPGVDITSTWFTSTTATASESGTSMATPHVTGAAAILLSERPTWTPAHVASQLLADATANVIVDAAGSPNRLLFSAPIIPSFVSLVPARLLESRSGAGVGSVDGLFAGLGVRGAGSVTELLVAGRGGVAVDASAVVLTVTVTEPGAAGFVTVFPCGSARPLASSVNFVAGATVANLVVSGVGVGGRVCVFTSAATQLVVDVDGFFPALTSSFVSLVPARLLESRSGAGVGSVDGLFAGLGVRGAGSVTELLVAGRGGVAVDASAVVLTVTVTEPGAAGFVTVFPCGSARPLASSVNFVAGATVANLVVSGVGVGGRVCVFTSAATQLVVDVDGFFPALTSSFVSLVPARLLESRSGAGVGSVDGLFAGLGVRGAGSVTELLVAGRGGVAVDASAVVLTVTVTEPGAAGFVTVFPCGSARPLASSVNFVAGATVANLVVSGVGVGGRVCVFTSAATQLVVDVDGYFE